MTIESFTLIWDKNTNGVRVWQSFEPEHFNMNPTEKELLYKISRENPAIYLDAVVLLASIKKNDLGLNIDVFYETLELFVKFRDKNV